MYEVKINYTRQSGEDNPGIVKETYLVDAVSCAEAEMRVATHIAPQIFGDGYEAPQVKKVNYFEIFPCADSEYWYKGKIEMIVVDGDKEIRKAVNVLQQANTISNALSEIKNQLGDYDCEITGLVKTPIVEVLRKETAE